MKKTIAIVLILSLCLGFAACAKQETPSEANSPTTTTAASTAPVGAERVYDFAALEDILDQYAYDYIGGWMHFGSCNDKLFFADHEYNTAAVNYYDFKTGEVQNLTTDEQNELSGPNDTNPMSIVVGSLPASNDPLEADFSAMHYHIYDLENESFFILDYQPAFRVIAYSKDKLYGNDESGNLCICERNGSEMQRIFIGNNSTLITVFSDDDGTYAQIRYWDDDENYGYQLVRIKDDEVEMLLRSEKSFYYDAGKYYFIDGDSVNQYDPYTAQTQQLCSIDGIGHLYFMAGPRVYFEKSIDDYNIALCYYDMESGTQEQFSEGMPALGGW